ncbi:eCIS core domain-containing protein [Nostoc sp.]|uniref:eCIS core domain-containing protein n=1 Tax=Nostoc sp. TaxID=1180 RepID=UPI002FF67321
MPEDEEELQMKSLDNSTLQRQQAPEEEELQMKPMVQRQAKGGMAAAPDIEASINQARGGGQAMAENIRHPMEQAFGADFSGVKVHTDGQSDQLNRSIQARAFTTGQDVFFRQGEYNPGSRGGQELLAHELTHVVQQNGGAVQRLQRDVTYPCGHSAQAVLPKNILPINQGRFQIQRMDKKLPIYESQMRKKAHPSLLQGIEDGMQPSKVVEQLLNNFRNRNDFESVGGTGQPFSGKGDCATLCVEFKEIIEKWLGLNLSIKYGRDTGLMFIEKSAIVDKAGRTGNVDGGNGWIFSDHTYLESSEGVIDVLFAQKGRKSAQHGEKVESKRYKFGDDEYAAVGGSDASSTYKKIDGKLLKML